MVTHIWVWAAAGWMVAVGACATAAEPVRSPTAEPAARMLATMDPAEQLAIGRAELVALRANVARVQSRITAIRAAVRVRESEADWRQLVCLEGRMHEVEAFAGRGERAYDALREAIRRGDAQAGATRVTLVALAKQGIDKQLSQARTCSRSERVAMVTEIEVLSPARGVSPAPATARGSDGVEHISLSEPTGTPMFVPGAVR